LLLHTLRHLNECFQTPCDLHDSRFWEIFRLIFTVSDLLFTVRIVHTTHDQSVFLHFSPFCGACFLFVFIFILDLTLRNVNILSFDFVTKSFGRVAF